MKIVLTPHYSKNHSGNVPGPVSRAVLKQFHRPPDVHISIDALFLEIWLRICLIIWEFPLQHLAVPPTKSEPVWPKRHNWIPERKHQKRVIPTFFR